MQDASFHIPDSVFERDAFQLAAALDAYEAASGRLAENCCDAELLEQLGRQLDTIRDRGLCVPGLLVPSLKLVIADADLVTALWRHTSSELPAEVLEDVRAGHAAAVNALRAAALKLLTRP